MGIDTYKGKQLVAKTKREILLKRFGKDPKFHMKEWRTFLRGEAEAWTLDTDGGATYRMYGDFFCVYGRDQGES